MSSIELNKEFNVTCFDINEMAKIALEETLDELLELDWISSDLISNIFYNKAIKGTQNHGGFLEFDIPPQDYR